MEKNLSCVGFIGQIRIKLSDLVPSKSDSLIYYVEWMKF